MGGLFAGLGVALSGLQAQQQVQLTESNNVANASTPGYAREIAVLSPVGYPVPGGAQAGGGVQVTEIQRVQSAFLNQQYWTQNAVSGGDQSDQQVLSEVQASLDEPGSSGLSSSLNQFWSAWQSLATSPESTSVRQQVIEAASTLTAQFNRLSGDMVSERANVDTEVRGQATQVNNLASQIAALNGQISSLSASGQPPNALLDQRAALMNQLSQYVPIKVTALPDGANDIAVGGTNLVQGNLAQTITVSSNPANNNFASLTWSQTGAAVAPSAGSLGALLNLRDTVIPGYQSRLDQVASTLATTVNAQQTAGYDANGNPGVALFTGTTAATIQVNPALTEQGVAAASTAAGVPGDGSNAQAVASLQNQALIANATIGDSYGSLVSQIGSDVQNATQRSTNDQQMLQVITQQQQSISGVSIDQEMTNMIQAEHAYQASAETITTINTMLGSLLQMVG